jgi:hypothetical protein
MDAVSGVDYSYRREWIRRRFEALASVFTIDILSYAILSNHPHVVLRNRPDVLANLSDEEVAIRWLIVFPRCRMKEHLAEPSQIDVQRVLADTELMAKIPDFERATTRPSSAPKRHRKRMQRNAKQYRKAQFSE